MTVEEIIPPEIWEKLEHTYFLGFDAEAFMEPLSERLKGVRNPLISPGRAFQSNLEALIAVVSMPILLASGTATEMRLQQLLMAERIRRIPNPLTDSAKRGDLPVEAEREAHTVAHGKLNQELATTIGIVQMGVQAWRFLHAGLRSHDVDAAAHELLRQSTVLCWGALEVLARDVFVALINENPNAAIQLLEHPSTRGRFNLKAISVEVLAIHGFDVSTRMGDVLVQQQDLAELAVIKDVYQALFPDARALHSTLGAKDLWLLNQRRHLIVHKRGIVDARYLERTGDKTERGSTLNVLPSDLKGYLTLVRDAGIEILGVVNPDNRPSMPSPGDAGQV